MTRPPRALIGALTLLALLALLALLVLLVLTGCTRGGGGSPESRPAPSTTQAAPAPAATEPAAMALPPVLLSEEQTTVTARVGQSVVLLLDRAEDWDVSVEPTGVARYVAGGDQGGYRSNAALVDLQPGVAEVVLVNRTDGRTRSVTLTVVAADAATAPGGPVPPPAVVESVARELLGRSSAEAEGIGARAGVTVRVVSVDGQSLAVTKDLRNDRVNVTLVADVVVDATVG